MDLEQFPSSEAGQRMIDSVSSGFYDRSYVGKWIFQVMGLEMDEAKRIVEELQEQAFPETATWGLMYHEMKYGLPVRENLPYEERRRFIYQKRDVRVPMNPYRMEAILESITGRKVHVDDESVPVNTFTVTVESGSNAVDVSAAIGKLKAIKQSHVSFTARFTAVARIELCGNVELYRSRYVQCGTVPGISTGLKLLDGELNIIPETAAYRKFHPLAGDSGEAGQYPKTSNGLKVGNADIQAEAAVTGYRVAYPETSEDLKVGTIPKQRYRAVYSDTGAEVEASATGYRFQNEVAGTQPMVSTGLTMKKAEAGVEAIGAGMEMKYTLAGETDTGTIPKISTGEKQTGKSVIPEVNTESYQVRYPLCGNSFEI